MQNWAVMKRRNTTSFRLAPQYVFNNFKLVVTVWQQQGCKGNRQPEAKQGRSWKSRSYLLEPKSLTRIDMPEAPN